MKVNAEHAMNGPRVFGIGAYRRLKTAAAELIEASGEGKSAKVTRGHPSQFSAWKDPYKACQMPVDVALDLQKITGLRSMTDAMVDLLGDPGTAGDVVDECMDLPPAIGRVTEVIRKIRDHHGVGGRRIVPSEFDEAIREIDAARRELEQLAQSLTRAYEASK
jgi:hypothetical protein